MTSNSGSIDELRQKRHLLRQEFDNLQLGEISANEFAGKINPFINELIFEQKWEDIIENAHRESLSNLSNNLNTSVTRYNTLNYSGDPDKASIQLTNLKNVASQIINQIGSIIDEHREERRKK